MKKKTQTQKIKDGKKLADMLSARYKTCSHVPKNGSLFEALKGDQKGLMSFLKQENPLFEELSIEEVMELLVEKEAISKEEHSKWKDLRNKELDLKVASVQVYEDLFTGAGVEYPKNKEEAFSAENKMLEAIDKDNNILWEVNKTVEKHEALQKELLSLKNAAGDLERQLLKSIRKNWKNGSLKHSLITKDKKDTQKKKTTVARAIPLNTLYPEKLKEEALEYGVTDIEGLDTIEDKQIQAIIYIADKAKHQTEDEKWVVDFWKENLSDDYGDFELVAFKDGDYTEYMQGKDKSLISGQEKQSDIAALEAVKDVKFHVRWEKKSEAKRRGKKRKPVLSRDYVITHHPLIKRITCPDSPLAKVKERKNFKKVERYHIVGIPKRLFSYSKNKFEVVNIDPAFFATLKYADPERERIGRALFRYSLLLCTEASFKKGKFSISKEKLIKRIGLEPEDKKNIGRQEALFQEYTTKLINHGTIKSADENADGKILFEFPDNQKPPEIRSKKDQGRF